MAALDETLGRLKAATDTQAVPEAPAIASEVSGRTFQLEENALGLRSVAVDLDGSAEATFTLDRPEEGIARVDRVGLDGRWLPSLAGRPIVARGGWTDERTFTVQVDEGPGLHAYGVALAFEGDSVCSRCWGRRSPARQSNQQVEARSAAAAWRRAGGILPLDRALPASTPRRT